MERDAEFRGSVWDERTGPKQQLNYTDANEPHDEQVQVWGAEMADAIEPWLKGFDSYDDKIAFFAALESEIRAVAEAAHASGMIRAKRNS